MIQVNELSPSEVLKNIQDGSVFIDVREEYEIAELDYDIPSKLNIPLGEIQVRLNEFPKNKPLIIGCRSGKRSMQACMYLKMAGYNNVQNLKGGIIGWSENGFPTK